jgi:3-oxoacyl-[acyl-carrier protein] reductase
MRLEGRTAIVTGSTKGVGEGIARRFAAEGANVVVCGRDRDAGEAIAAELGGKSAYLPLDLISEESVKELVATTVERFGAIDVLVNNAAATDRIAQADRAAGEIASEDFDYIVKIGLYGPFWMIKHSLASMKDRPVGACIINISSGASIGGVGNLAAYTCAKGGLNSLTKQVAVDYGPHGVRCNTLVLGLVVTDLVKPLISHPKGAEAFKATSLHGRMGSPADIGAFCAFLASDEGAFINGTLIPADGGLTAKISMPDVGGIFAEIVAESQAGGVQ